MTKKTSKKPETPENVAANAYKAVFADYAKGIQKLKEMEAGHKRLTTTLISLEGQMKGLVDAFKLDEAKLQQVKAWSEGTPEPK